MNLASLQHFRSLRQIFKSSVGAAAHNNLVDFNIAPFCCRVRIFRQVRVSNNRHKFIKFNFNFAHVICVCIRLNAFPFAVYAAFKVSFCFFVHRENAVFGACFNSHIANGKAVCHFQLRHAVAAKFQRLVTRAVNANHAD